MAANGTTSPLSGYWKPGPSPKHFYYGTGCVEKHLLGILPTPNSKVCIVTGNSLATKTPALKDLEAILGERHALSISNIRQHGPLSDVDRATDEILSKEGVDVIISLGGGSPIDSSKVISLRAKEKGGSFLTHITIPTTLSAAECTAGGGYTKPDGVKVGFRDTGMAVAAIFYDPYFARHTPKDLWISTGMRAMDHAVESMYHPTASEVPWKALSLWAVGELVQCLAKARESHPNDDEVTVRLMLAAYASSGLKGENIVGGMGLSHSLGHALGSPYGIPHGLTSCMTLGKVVKLRAGESVEKAQQIARLLPAFGLAPSGDATADAMEVGSRIMALVASLDLGVLKLARWNVGEDQIPIIAQRALGGKSEGALYERVVELVQTLF